MNLKNRIIVSLGIAFFLTVIIFFSFQSSEEEKMNELKTVSLSEWKTIYENNKDNQEYIILDVRTPEEYNTDKIEDSININFYDPNFKEQLNQLDKNKKYLIYCRSGSRSSKTLSLMKELKFVTVYDLDGGIIAWNDAN